jgi:hypothetical protein
MPLHKYLKKAPREGQKSLGILLRVHGTPPNVGFCSMAHGCREPTLSIIAINGIPCGKLAVGVCSLKSGKIGSLDRRLDGGI